MGKLKLAFDARAAQYEGHGVASYSLGLIQSLASLGDRFEYVFLVDPRRAAHQIRFPRNASFISSRVSKDDQARDFWEQVILPRKLAQLGVHLFHGLDYIVPIVRAPFVRVATFHDAIVFTPFDSRPWLSRMRLRLLLRAIAASVDAIVVDSDFSKEEIARYLPASRTKVTRIWSGVADAFFTPVQEGTETKEVAGDYILYYGGYRRRKNVQLLLRAFHRVCRTRDVRLVLVGNMGAASQQIRDTITSLDLGDVVTLYGFASQEELKLLLDECAVFVSPSSIEGFGLPVAEAMARGAPVVCSAQASLPEIAGDAAVYFEGIGVEDLVRALEQVLDDADLRRCMKEKGLVRAQQFRWQVVSRQFSDLYTRLIAEKFGI